VNEVAAIVAKTRTQTRSTTLTVMERLRTKGFLIRQKRDGMYRYSPVESKENLFQSFLADFVDSFLGGSVQPLVEFLTHREDLGPKELEVLDGLIAKIKKEEGEND
jgi:predicted transcriptional regulator